jgi:hypothetical protein
MAGGCNCNCKRTALMGADAREGCACSCANSGRAGLSLALTRRQWHAAGQQIPFPLLAVLLLGRLAAGLCRPKNCG